MGTTDRAPRAGHADPGAAPEHAAAVSASQAGIAAGLHNLLVGTAGLQPGSELLVVNQDDGVIDPRLPAAIDRAAKAIGARVTTIAARKVSSIGDIPDAVRAAMHASPVTLLNHRLSSMLRLMPLPGGLCVANHFTTLEGLACAAATVAPVYWRELLRLVHARIARAGKWSLTCPDGTELRGTIPEAVPSDVTVGSSSQTFSTASFPVGVFKPLPAVTACGTLTIRRLATSGIHFVVPESLILRSGVRAGVADGRIQALDGDRFEVDRLRRFLESAGDRYGKDPYLLSGWHAGINAQVRPEHRPDGSFERWLFLGHQSPRVVHFHVVGRQAPGEYSIACLDPTIRFDDEVLWHDGRLVFAERPEVASALAAHGDPALAAAFTTLEGIAA